MKKVTIVGVGALGSHVAQFLRNEADLRIIDFDVVESKNTASQFHPVAQVRRKKTESLAKTLQFLWGMKVDAVPHKLTSDNALQLLSGAELVIDCLDNAEGRRIIQKTARLYATGTAEGYPEPNVLHGALAANGQYGRVVWDENFAIDDEAGVGQATCEGGEFLPFIVIVAGYLARAAQVFLKEGKKVGFEINPTGAFRV